MQTTERVDKLEIALTKLSEEVAKTIQTVNRASLIQMRLSENFEEWKEKMDAKMAQTDAEMAKRDAEMAQRDAEMAQSRNEFNEWKLHSEKEFENWKIQTKKEEKKEIMKWLNSQEE